MPKLIGLDAPRMPRDVGEGIFGFGAPDGSLGRSAFVAPESFAGNRKQGVFWKPYSYKWYEVEEPELRWALEKRPGLPLYPGSSARGMVLVGPAMGGLGTAGGALMGSTTFLLAAAAVVGVVWWMSQGGR